jgi:hypothetical protein
MDKTFSFTKERIIFLEISIYDETLYDHFMTTKQRDTLENLVPIMPYDNIIGGPDYEHS